MSDERIGDGEAPLLDWWSAPPGWIGGVVPETVVVARNARAVILVEEIVVYPTGITMALMATMRPAPRPVIEPRPPGSGDSAAREPTLGISFVEAPPEDWERPETPADRVVFGVEFEDGRRATRAEPLGGPAGDFSFRAHYEGEDVSPDPASNVILNFLGGGGSSDSISWDAFVWPLPRGDLRLFGSWVDAGMDEHAVLLSAEAIADALARSRRVFGEGEN
jgi:hypothetical protein